MDTLKEHEGINNTILLNYTDPAGELMHDDGDETAPSELVDTEE